MSAAATFDLKHRSRQLTEGPERAAARAYLKGIGYDDEALAKPLVAVASTWIETMPCNFHLRALAAQVKDDAFLEWAEVHEHRYGSPKAPVMAAVEAGRDVLFDIDWQGAMSIAASAPDDVVRVFILPPTMADLARRLR